MSNFTGVTFAQQKVLPSDDAIIRRAILPDGVLYGCELSYSGSTLTMTAGQMILCGRQIRHPSSQNWAVVDATSGYARLLLTVDLTRTSTKEVFEQVVDSIEYASAEDGFPELEQTDVNVSGSRYQVVACVVSLGAGGITGIVSQLQQSRVEGGGGLNFSVVGGLTQPSDPKENMIWVYTDVDITSYIFSATEPEAPADGKNGPVWISTGTSSSVEFDALKKHSIQVYPIAAKQYIGGAWVDKTAKSYQNGAWVDWWNGELYKNGNEYDSITGGWAGYAQMVDDGDAVAVPTITKNSASMTMQQPGVSGGTVRTVNKVYISGYTQLEFDGTITGGSDNTSICRFCVWSEMGTTSRQNVVVTKPIDAATTGAFTVDISSVNPGEYYIGFAFYTGSCKVVMRSLVMK